MRIIVRRWGHCKVDLSSHARCLWSRYWNAAQHEMVCTGKMHNYMRMYWGKRLLEWSTDAGIAYTTAIRLNDKWSRSKWLHGSGVVLW